MANEIKEHEDYNFVDGVTPEGIVSPSADSLIEKAESKYGLVIFGARRARQINAYYANLQDSKNPHIGPLVDADSTEKSLSVAMREIITDRVEAEHKPGTKFNEDGYPIAEEPNALIDFSVTEYPDAIEEEYIPAGSDEVIAIEEVILDDHAE
ncbi:MAG: DNA-directed RNA polymerase subunit omega [Rothia mucilaginosa]|uniref:DNA-directed RNA polymerase subunit omega n=1 Tax=uncultured Rothia sp. TaxID=316088 RepID=UPI0025ED7DA2|nr:DNA-directed RNA polymerase subunit omega [uncultured Rothia sp.]MDU6365622.1 DNA-directed RNA polymerase subunit omega [Rothia mucilaginosa]